MFEAGHFHASEQPLGLDASESSVSRGLLAPVELRESRALNTGLFIKLCYVLCVISHALRFVTGADDFTPPPPPFPSPYFHLR